MQPEKSDDSEADRTAQAGDVMTSEVITVGPDQPIRDVAKLLLEHQISAVPVVNSDGVPIGMVSDGDLIGRDETQRLARNDWWLAVMTGEQLLDGSFLMTSPITTASIFATALWAILLSSRMDASNEAYA
jgi:CBS domain-containing protein